MRDFATRLSKELGLQLHTTSYVGDGRSAKTRRYQLSEWNDIIGFGWIEINIGVYDKKQQKINISREIFEEGDAHRLSWCDEETQSRVKNARRRGYPLVWVEMAIRTTEYHCREQRYVIVPQKSLSESWMVDEAKKWLEERRAAVDPEDVAVLKVINSRGFDPFYRNRGEEGLVVKDGKCGFIDKQGNIICEPLYDTIRPLRNGNVVVCNEKNWSLINRKGEMLKSLEYDDIGVFNDGFAVVTFGGKYGIIDELGNVLGELKYDKIKALEAVSEFVGEEGKLRDKFAEYFEACIDGKWGFLNKQGKEMSPFVYDDIQMSDFKGGFVRVCKNGKWSYVNDKCEEMCEIKYEFDWDGFLRLGDKRYKPNADGVLVEYDERPIDDDDLPF